MALSKHDPIWATSGHGGAAQRPSAPPPEDVEIVEKRRACDRIEAELYAARLELREAIARAEGRKQ